VIQYVHCIGPRPDTTPCSSSGAANVFVFFEASIFLDQLPAEERHYPPFVKSLLPSNRGIRAAKPVADDENCDGRCCCYCRCLSNAFFPSASLQKHNRLLLFPVPDDRLLFSLHLAVYDNSIVIVFLLHLLVGILLLFPAASDSVPTSTSEAPDFTTTARQLPCDFEPKKNGVGAAGNNDDDDVVVIDEEKEKPEESLLGYCC